MIISNKIIGICIMTRISTNLGSWSTQIYESIRGTNPISIFNRICIGDQTCFFDRVWSLDSSKNLLREKIQVCKEKAGIRGDKYSPDLELWKSEVVGLSLGVPEVVGEGVSKTLPTQASSKNELIYNHELAKAATDQELDTLSRNVSTYATLAFLHNQLGPGPSVDSSILFDLIAKSEKNPQNDVLKMYIDHFSPQMRWGVFQKAWLKCAYYFSSGIISGVIHTTFQNMLAELRLSTNGKTESIFISLVNHLERFLKDYRGEKTLEDFIDKKDMPALCRELAPHLVNEFFPNISFFKVMFKKIPFMSIPAYLLDSTVGVAFNFGVRALVRSALPEILQTLSETLEATVVAKLTDQDGEQKEAPINYQIAIPVVRFVNEKLFAFSEQLKEPPLDVDEPPPPELAHKLEGVIDELLKLSVNPSNDPMIREGMRNGLIDGGYQLMKFLESEQETLLQQALSLSSLPFTESQEPIDIEADKKEFEALWANQEKLLETVNDRVFNLEAKKFVGSPSKQVTYVLTKEHNKIKRYLEEGLSDFIGLKSSLRIASEGLQRTDYRDYDMALAKHLVFWDGFLSMVKEGTKQHNPKPVREMLYREFYPLCKEGVAQIDRISELQDQWVLHTRHRELKRHFQEVSFLLSVKRVQDLNLSQVQRVLHKIEVLLPATTPELQVLKRFVESFSSLKSIEGYLKDLLAVKSLLRKQKQGSLNRESLEEFKKFLSKYPQLQKEREFALLYKKYAAVCQGEGAILGTSKELVLLELSKRIEREIVLQSQKVKDLQINLLHRIYPTRKASSFKVPCPLGDLLKELDQWVKLKRNGYEALEKGNLKELSTGTKDLQRHVGLLEKTIHKMEPHALYFPVESVLDGLAWTFGDLTNVPGITGIKQNLLRDLKGIIEGVSPLITAKKEEGKKNLYSWIEKLALYESLKYFKSKNN
jgi:hypothetical protein